MMSCRFMFCLFRSLRGQKRSLGRRLPHVCDTFNSDAGTDIWAFRIGAISGVSKLGKFKGQFAW